MSSVRKRRLSLSKHPVIRIIFIWIISALGLLVMDWLLEGLQFEPPRRVFIAAAVLGFLNALLWPFLSRVLLPFAVFTAGLFFLLLNGFMLWLAAKIVPGFEVDTIWTATLAALGVTAGSCPRTFIFRPCDANLATMAPTLPNPMTPSVRPVNSRPWNFFFSHLPAFMDATA